MWAPSRTLIEVLVSGWAKRLGQEAGPRGWAKRLGQEAGPRGWAKRLGQEVAPGLAGGLDDRLIGLEHPVREPGLAQGLPHGLHRVQLRGARGQPDQRQGLGHEFLSTSS